MVVKALQGAGIEEHGRLELRAVHRVCTCNFGYGPPSLKSLKRLGEVLEGQILGREQARGPAERRIALVSTPHMLNPGLGPRLLQLHSSRADFLIDP